MAHNAVLLKVYKAKTLAELVNESLYFIISYITGFTCTNTQGMNPSQDRHILGKALAVCFSPQRDSSVTEKHASFRQPFLSTEVCALHCCLFWESWLHIKTEIIYHCLDLIKYKFESLTWIGSLCLVSGLLNTSVALTYWISLSPFWPLDGTWFVSDERRSSFLLLTLTGDFGGDSEVGLLSYNKW